MASPVPSNWYDRTHSGHGFDFQLFAHDPVYGQDVYFLTFYTYASDGTPEWYQAAGALVDGVFVPGLQANGSTLYRLIYTSTAPGQIAVQADNVDGSVIVDFNQAAQSPACRNVDRSSAPQLAVMNWNIGSDSGQWCVEPIVTLQQHASPDFNGHWSAPSDSGWGFELLDVSPGDGSAPLFFVYVYYPGPDGQPAWATGSGVPPPFEAPFVIPLRQVDNGYCRTCQPPAQGATAGPPIGSITLALTAATSATTRPTGTASITAKLSRQRRIRAHQYSDRMLSVPTGQ